VKLTRIQIDMLWRVALAEQCLDGPSTPATYDRNRAIKALKEKGLVKFDLHWRVTAEGEAAITALLDQERAAVLHQSRERWQARCAAAAAAATSQPSTEASRKKP